MLLLQLCTNLVGACVHVLEAVGTTNQIAVTQARVCDARAAPVLFSPVGTGVKCAWLLQMCLRLDLTS